MEWDIVSKKDKMPRFSGLGLLRYLIMVPNQGGIPRKLAQANTFCKNISREELEYFYIKKISGPLC